MAQLVNIGIVGCGAIGSSLAKAVACDFSRDANLVALYDLDKTKACAIAQALRKPGLAVETLTEAIARSDLIIEAASAHDSFAIARGALGAGRDVMILSVGGILTRFGVLQKLAKKMKARVYIPTGAIAGIDALKAASLGKIKTVTLRTTKPVGAFYGVPYITEKNIRLNAIRTERLIFRGSAQQAAKAFPQNINVAATLSLAGVGPEKTRVEIIASKKAKKNIHCIEVLSQAGTIRCQTENVAHPGNPKTSYLAVLSAMAMLRQLVRPVTIGT